MSDVVPSCSRCGRVLSAEKPLRLPDARVYCVACCESMAADEFEMETGDSFSRWIEKHPTLVMQYQPLELTVRRAGFFFPLVLSLAGAGLYTYGLIQMKHFTPALGATMCVGVVMCAFFGWLAIRGAKAYLRAINFKLVLADGTFQLEHGDR